jgi:hypothetical protein
MDKEKIPWKEIRRVYQQGIERNTEKCFKQVTILVKIFKNFLKNSITFVEETKLVHIYIEISWRTCMSLCKLAKKKKNWRQTQVQLFSNTNKYYYINCDKYKFQNICDKTHLYNLLTHNNQRELKKSFPCCLIIATTP